MDENSGVHGTTGLRRSHRVMSTINILGMSQDTRQELIDRAKRELLAGDERLARQLLVAAAQQFAAQSRHHADEVLTRLDIARRALVADGSQPMTPAA